MKRILGIAGVGALLLFAVSPAVAFADNGPHVRNQSLTTGQCASCHRVHTSPDSGGYLLKVSEAQLCYNCHGGTGAGATTNVQFGYPRRQVSGG